MIIYPKEYLNSVKDISIEFLGKNKIKGIILDVDNTLINLNKEMPEGIEKWAENVKRAGIKLCIVSNSNQKEKVASVAKKIDIPFIYFAKKPLKTGFLKAQKLLGIDFKSIAAVGDQIFTDVIGANRCKMFSILVKPIEEKDYLITKIKRPIEKMIINRYLKKRRSRGRSI